LGKDYDKDETDRLSRAKAQGRISAQEQKMAATRASLQKEFKGPEYITPGKATKGLAKEAVQDKKEERGGVGLDFIKQRNDRMQSGLAMSDDDFGKVFKMTKVEAKQNPDKFADTVRAMQKALNEAHKDDKNWKKLATDGMVGTNTWKALVEKHSDILYKNKAESLGIENAAKKEAVDKKMNDVQKATLARLETIADVEGQKIKLTFQPALNQYLLVVKDEKGVVTTCDVALEQTRSNHIDVKVTTINKAGRTEVGSSAFDVSADASVVAKKIVEWVKTEKAALEALDRAPEPAAEKQKDTPVEFKYTVGTTERTMTYAGFNSSALDATKLTQYDTERGLSVLMNPATNEVVCFYDESQNKVINITNKNRAEATAIAKAFNSARK
jgi:hypothetical protein